MTIAKYSQTLFRWLKGFAPAYQSVVPPGADAKDVHILAPQVTGSFSATFAQPLYLIAQNATGHTKLTELADSIKEAVGEGGLLIRTDSGCVRIELGNPMFQIRNSPDKNTSAGVFLLNITIY